MNGKKSRVASFDTWPDYRSTTTTPQTATKPYINSNLAIILTLVRTRKKNTHKVRRRKNSNSNNNKIRINLKSPWYMFCLAHWCLFVLNQFFMLLVAAHNSRSHTIQAMFNMVHRRYNTFAHAWIEMENSMWNRIITIIEQPNSNCAIAVCILPAKWICFVVNWRVQSKACCIFVGFVLFSSFNSFIYECLMYAQMFWHCLNLTQRANHVSLRDCNEFDRNVYVCTCVCVDVLVFIPSIDWLVLLAMCFFLYYRWFAID